MNGRTELPLSEGRNDGCELDRRTRRLNSGSMKINVPWSYSGRIGVRNLRYREEGRVGQGRAYSLYLIADGI